MSDLCSEQQLCSLYSQANGEDPIGSATPFAQCLIVEIPTPWDRDVWQTSPFTRQIKQIALAPQANRIPVRLLAMQPEPHVSREGETRVFFYQRPEAETGSSLFASYRKQAYAVPTADLPDLLQALVSGVAPAGIPSDDAPGRDLFLCTHDARDVCCGQFGSALLPLLRRQGAAQGAAPVHVWQVSHLGGHRLAPTLMDMPSGQAFGHLKPELVEALIARSGPLDELLACYRGWSGMSKYAQIAEREVWRAKGWAWPLYRRTAHTQATHEDGSVHIRIEYESPSGADQGACDLHVAPRDKVHTLNNSHTDKFFYIDRYQVTAMANGVTAPA